MNDHDEYRNASTLPSSASTAARPRPRHCQGLHLHQLDHDIREICARNPQGPQSAQAERRRILLLCAHQWFVLGARHKRAVNLTENHIADLVAVWHFQQLSAATIRNRLVCLRWLARKIGKPRIVAPSNRTYGAERSEP
jgi:hypothetical protein